MKYTNEYDGMLILENTEKLGVSDNGSSYVFEYHSENPGGKKQKWDDHEDGNYRTLLAKSFLSNYDKVATFLGNEGGFSIYYNAEGQEFYLCEINADGKLPDRVKVYDMFSSSFGLDEGCTYTIQFEYSALRLSSSDPNASVVQDNGGNYWAAVTNDNGYFDPSRSFSNEILNSVKAIDISRMSSTSDDGRKTRSDDTTAATTEIAEDTTLAADTQSSALEEADDQARSDENTVIEQETAVITEVQTESELQPEKTNGGGLTGALIVVSLLAAAAVAGCVVLFNKYRAADKAGKAYRLRSTQTQEKYDDISAKYEQLQKEQEKQATALQQSRKENTALRENLSRTNEISAQVQNDQNDYLEKQRKLETEWREERDKLTQELKQLRVINSDYLHRIRQLEEKNQQLSEIAAAAGQSDVLDEPDNLSFCLSTEALQQQDVRFLAVNVSVAGSVSLSEAPYKRAPIALVGNRAYLNPYFFQGLRDRRESYNNLVTVKSVYEINGLKGGSVTYGLREFVPALLEHDGGTGYIIKRVGKINLIN